MIRIIIDGFGWLQVVLWLNTDADLWEYKEAG